MAIQPFSYIPRRDPLAASGAMPKNRKKGMATTPVTAAVDDTDAYTDPRENRSNRGEGNPYGNRSGAYHSDGSEGSMRKNFAAANPDPMYGPPAPAFPEREDYKGQNDAIRNSTSMIPEEEDYEGQNNAIRNSTSMIPEEDDSTDYEQEAQTYNQQVADEKMKDFARQNRDGSEGAGGTQGIGNNGGDYDPSEITAYNERQASAAANGGNSNASRPTPQGNGVAGQDFTGAFRNSDTQGKINQAMSPQAPAQAAQGGQEDLVANWAKYHGQGPKNAYNNNSAADRAMLAAMQEAQRTGKSVSRVANGALSTEGRRAAGKLIPYSKNPNSIYAKGR